MVYLQSSQLAKRMNKCLFFSIYLTLLSAPALKRLSGSITSERANYAKIDPVVVRKNSSKM